MLKPKPELIIARGIEQNLQCDSTEIEDDNTNFINALVVGAVNGVAKLPDIPPFEIHPYKNLLPLQNFEKYIIGTFPPISYVLDLQRLMDAGVNQLAQPAGAIGENDNRPQIPFYHGNMGSLWKVLFNEIELGQLNAFVIANNRIGARNYLINKLTELEINYCDIIDSTQRSKYTSEDKNLYNICINENLICHILQNKKITILMFTSGGTFSQNGLGIQENGMVKVNGEHTKSLNLFLRKCQELGLTIEIQCQPFYNWTNISDLTVAQRSNKLIYELRITNPINNFIVKYKGFDAGSSKIFKIITPFSPAAHGTIEQHPIIQHYREEVNQNITIREILIGIYQNFRQNNLDPIYNLNQ